MSVQKMRAELSAQEWLEWGVYFARKAQRIELEMEKAKGS